MSEESARGMLLNLMPEWRMTTGHGSRTWADRILRRHCEEVTESLGQELRAVGIEEFVRRLVGPGAATYLWQRHAGEMKVVAPHDTHGCTGAWEVVGAFGRRCADCKASMAPLVPPVDMPKPEGEVWTRNRCPSCNHTASGVRVIFAEAADDRARESIHQLLKQRGYFKEEE